MAMSSLSFLSRSARSSLKPEHLPLAVAKWLVSAVGREAKDCIYTLPEYDPEAKQAVLSWLNANNRPMPRLLFESREKAWNFLAALPSEERTFYIYIPKDAPVAFYLDIDKPNDERWKGHPNYSWEETLEALKVFVSFTYHRLTGGKSEPDWFDDTSLRVFSADGKPGAKKLMSKHVHTTKDPSNENRFWFSSRASLASFLKCMREDVTKAYWDSDHEDHKDAKVLAYTPHKERYFKQIHKRADGSEEVVQAERTLEFVFDVQGAGDQWRLPLCRKSGGVQLEPDDDELLEDDPTIIGAGDPVLLMDIDEKDFADANFPVQEKKREKREKNTKTSTKEVHNFEEPEVTKQLEELLKEEKAFTGTYLQRRSEFKYYLRVDMDSKQERSCLICKRTHGSCPGWIKVASDFSKVAYGCYRDEGTVLEFPLPGGEQRVKDEEMLRQLRESKDFKNALSQLPWYTDDLAQKILSEPYVSKDKALCFELPIPKGQTCPYCNKPHKKLKIEITRKMVQATIICTRAGRKTDKRGRMQDVKEELSSKERFQAKRRKLMEASAAASSSSSTSLNELEQEFELRDDPDSPFEKPLVRNSFDQDDPLTWRDFENLLKSREPYATFEDLKKYALRYINRVFARVGINRYIYKENLDDGLFTMNNDISKINMKIECEKRRIAWKEIVDRLSPFLPVYNNVDFWPDPATTPKKTFNIWPGFQARLLKAPLEEFQDDPRLAEMKQYYRDIQCGGNEDCYRHEMRVFQLLYTQPAKKKEGGIFLCGGQGAGKGTGTDFQKLVLGKKLYWEDKGQNILNEKYTDHLEGKLLVVANELGSTKEAFRPLWEKIKAFTTDTETAIEKKYVSKYSVKNFAFLFILSNHENSLVLEKDDRRWACLEVSESKKGDFDYWDGIRERCFNQETANLFFSWLCKTHEFDDVNIRRLPETEARTRIKVRSLNSIDRFLLDVKDQWSEHAQHYASLASEEEKKQFLKTLSPGEYEAFKNARWIQSTLFFEKFCTWTYAHKEPDVKDKIFTSHISKILKKERRGEGFFYDLYSIK